MFGVLKQGLESPWPWGKNGEVIWNVHESCALTSSEQLGAVTSLQIDLELNGLVSSFLGLFLQVSGAVVYEVDSLGFCGCLGG